MASPDPEPPRHQYDCVCLKYGSGKPHKISHTAWYQHLASACMEEERQCIRTARLLGDRIASPLSRTEQLRSYSRLLSCATPVYIPAPLRSTFPHYSGLHSRATPVHTPVLLQSTTGLDWTPLDLLFDWTCARLDMGSSCHSSVTYVPISRHLYLLVPSLFSAHIYLHLLSRP